MYTRIYIYIYIYMCTHKPINILYTYSDGCTAPRAAITTLMDLWVSVLQRDQTRLSPGALKQHLLRVIECDVSSRSVQHTLCHIVFMWLQDSREHLICNMFETQSCMQSYATLQQDNGVHHFCTSHYCVHTYSEQRGHHSSTL